MALFKNLFGKKKIINPEAVSNQIAQSKLIDDIPVAADWVLKALNSSGYKVDYTIESMKELDRFFDEQNVPGGLLASPKRGNIIFAIGSLMGQIAISNFGGKWNTDDSDPEGEINIEVELSSGDRIWPVQRAMKRIMNGAEDGIYAYMYVLQSNVRK